MQKRYELHFPQMKVFLSAQHILMTYRDMKDRIGQDSGIPSLKGKGITPSRMVILKRELVTICFILIS